MTEAIFDSCIKEICDGDKNGLKKIYEEYLPYIYTVVFNILGNKEDAEDVTSSFFIKLWTTADRYRSGGNHRAYMAAVARNMAIDSLRKRKREIPEEDGFLSDARQHSSGFEESIVERLTLKEAMKKLSDIQKEIIHLKLYGGLTFREIASVVGKPQGTVSWQYNEALKILRRFGYE